MPELRENRARRKLREGKPVIAISSSDADTIDMLGSLGVVDAIWIEMEHGPVTWHQLGDLSRACDLWGMTSLVRVNTSEPWLIGRALDRGVHGVIVPHVNTRKEAQRAVHGVRFAPQGMRGMAGSRQGYGITDYLTKANDEIMVVVLIEEVEAVNNLPEILTAEHIDCFMVVPGDLSQSMGPQYLGQPGHPDVQAVIEKSIKQIVAAGKATGTTANDSTVGRYVELGARLFLTSTQGYVANGLRGFQERTAAKSS